MNTMQLDCCKGKENQLFSNVSLSSIAEKLDIVLERVKDLKMCYLIEPIETALKKIKELNKVIEQHRSKQYGDYTYPDQDGRKELGFGKSDCKSACPKVMVKKESQEAEPSSGSSCVCCNSRGERSCHCGSSCGSVASDRLEPNLHKTETYCIKDTPKCNPCRCTVDASGKRHKSLDCKQAARARRENRPRPRTADANFTTALDPELLLLGGTISQSMIKLEASWPEKTFKFTKEDNVLDPFVAAERPKERATERAVLCNMSSDSSSEDSTRSSSDDICHLLDYQQGEEAPCKYSSQKNDCLGSNSYLRTYGCNRVAADNTCPCGCGDLMELPERSHEQRFHCRCENCGKELTEGDQEVACKTDDRDRRGPRSKAACNSRCDKLQKNSGSADIQRYIEELEEQCRKKDNIITQLQDRLINMNEGFC